MRVSKEVDPDRQLIKFPEFARRLGITRVCLWHMVQRGRIQPPLRLGQMRFYRLSYLDAVLAQMEQPVTPGSPGGGEAAPAPPLAPKAVPAAQAGRAVHGDDADADPTGRPHHGELNHA